MKKKILLTRAKIRRLTEEKGKARIEKYRLGRKVVQTEVYYGLPDGRQGWVTNVWPMTSILFWDGRECHMSDELDKVLDVTNEYEEDLEGLRDRILRSAKGFSTMRRKGGI